MMVLAALLLLAHTASSQKILALHGGGMTGASFEAGIQDLVTALPGYEFVFPDGAYAGTGSGRLWISDPPSKSGPSTDPDWAVDSVQALDEIVRTQGPFWGILGYSQGSAMVPVYLAQMNSSLPSFEVAMMFCGYLTATHTGILGTVTAASPFDDIPALVWMGEEDAIITNEMTRAQADEFTSPEVICSAPAGHAVPGNSDSTFSQVVAFVESGGSVTDSSGTCTGGNFEEEEEEQSGCDECVTTFMAAGGCDDFYNDALIPPGCDDCGEAAWEACGEPGDFEQEEEEEQSASVDCSLVTNKEICISTDAGDYSLCSWNRMTSTCEHCVTSCFTEFFNQNNDGTLCDLMDSECAKSCPSETRGLYRSLYCTLSDDTETDVEAAIGEACSSWEGCSSICCSDGVGKGCTSKSGMCCEHDGKGIATACAGSEDPESPDVCVGLKKQKCKKQDTCEFKRQQCISIDEPIDVCVGLKKKQCKKQDGVCKFRKKTNECAMI